jgi:hypothetical protein
MQEQSKSHDPSSIGPVSRLLVRSRGKRRVAVGRKPKDRRKQPRMFTAVRTATKERRKSLALWENIFNLPKRKRDRLIRLLDELTDLNEEPPPRTRVSEGRITLWLAGHGRARLFPQTDVVTLAHKLVASDNWRKVMANEVLLYLEMADRKGFPEAAPEALRWCADYDLAPRDWAFATLSSNSPPKANMQGKRPLDSQWKQLLKDAHRTAAVTKAARDISSERKALGYCRPDVEMGNDKLWRAKKLLAGDWKNLDADTRSAHSTSGIRKSREKIKKMKCPLYLDTRRLMDVLKFDAPSLHKLLS